MITGYDHVQVAIPRAGEDAARRFYGDVLGMTEVAKPPVLAARGGCWFRAGAAVLHLGVEAPFAPARKAHPAFLVDRSRRGCRQLSPKPVTSASAGDGDIPGVRRFHTFDPFGNRLEFQQA